MVNLGVCLQSLLVPPPILPYRLLSPCPLSRRATAGNGSLGEALSNNDQSADLYTVTLRFHTPSEAAVMGGEGLKARAGQGMASTKIDLHYSRIFRKEFQRTRHHFILMAGVNCFGVCSGKAMCLLAESARLFHRSAPQGPHIGTLQTGYF